jgi:hypothetical protein
MNARIFSLAFNALQNGGMNYFSLSSIIKMMGRKEVRRIGVLGILLLMRG